MFERFRKLVKSFSATLKPVTRPIKKVVTYVLSPLGNFLAPYKNRLEKIWAIYAANHPSVAIWIRRGSKLVAVVYALYFVFAIGLFGEIPTIEELQEMQTLNASEVYASNGALIGKFYKENRKDIRFEALPIHVVNALVATEDERYFSHGGVDIRSFGRVLFRSVIKGDDAGGGGSTLSQQLAKNLFGRKKYRFLSTPINKVREMLIAERLERAYDKKNLLSFYLNTVPFGSNVFGIEMASKRFFNKSATDLDIEEGAVLIGMLKANTIYNPKRNLDRAQDRRNVVMSQMVKNNFLAKSVFDSLKNTNIELSYQPVLNHDEMASYFKDYLRTTVPKILESYKKEDGTFYDIYKDGLKIITSIDSEMQVLAEQVMNERMSKLQKVFDDHWSGAGQKWWIDDKILEDAMHQSERWKKLAADGLSAQRIRDNFTKTKIPMTVFAWDNDAPSEDDRNFTPLDSIKYYFRQLNAGFSVVDPKTGLVKVWVGGTDFNYFQYDHVHSRRQVGSTFKPIVYAAAIQSGVRPCEYIPNRWRAYLPDGTTKNAYDLTEEERKDTWSPRNSDDAGYRGSYSMEGALTNSVNVVSAYLINKIGIDAVRNLAKNMGVSTDIQRDLSISLGTAEISLYDMMRVYSTFAARGKRVEPVTVLKIISRDGKTIADFTPQIKALANAPQILSVDQADIMTRMMKSVVDDGTGSRLRYNYDLNNDLAGKTGTTQSHADGWFMCYTPNLVCGAWVGGVLPIVRFRDMNLGQGAYTALPLCGMFLQKLYKLPHFAALKIEKFPEPAKWIKDSMNCEHKKYTFDEIVEIDSLRSRDTTNHFLPADFTDSLTRTTANNKIAPQRTEDHDLRDKPVTPALPNNKPLSPSDKPSTGATPQQKPPIAPKVTSPAKPKIEY